MIKLSFLFFTLISHLYALNWDYSEDVKKIHKESLSKTLDSIDQQPSQDTILPKEDMGKSFDGQKSKEQLLSGECGSNSVFEFISSLSVDNSFISEAEDFLSEEQFDVDPESGEYIEICVESSKPISFSLVRTLDYKLEKSLVEQNVEVTVCAGHKDSKKVPKGKGDSHKKKKEKELSADESIKWFKVECHKGGIGHRDKVTWNWLHIDDCEHCRSKKSQLVTDKKEVWKLTNENWVYNNQKLKELAEGSHSALISKQCLDNSKKIINGQEFSKCWVEQFNFQYKPSKVSGCDFLKNQFCKLKSSRCLNEGLLGCLLWERTFHCYKKLNKKKQYQISGENIGLEDPIFETEYEPNKSLPDVATKIQIFKEMDSQMKNSEIVDLKKFEFFSGKDMRCFVNFLKDAAYDCCNKMGGLAVDGLVAKCDEEEVALNDLRNRGQCVFVGTKDEYNLGVKTATRHVYCCYPSKLATIFNVEARKQLGLGFGDAKKPNCGGLTQQQIQQLDFDKMDLSGAFESVSDDLNERIERMKKRILGSLDS